MGWERHGRVSAGLGISLDVATNSTDPRNLLNRVGVHPKTFAAPGGRQLNLSVDNKNGNMVVTPWEVKGDIDYSALITRFGTQPLTEKLKERIAKQAGYMHMQLRRNVYFSHRDLDWWLNEYDAGRPVGLYTGRGPSGHVHLGHLLPWFFCAYLQKAYNAHLYFQMTDDEKFLHRDDLTLDETIGYTYENALDVIACGVQPELTHIFSDTDHIGHIYKLGLQVSKRITMSTVKAVFGFTDSDNIGLTWYPALQAMTCFLQSYRERRKVACLIPAAIDQDPYWRMTRDIAEKMGYYKPTQIHNKFLPPLTQGGKMSASQPESAIFTTDKPEAAAKKVMGAYTGGRETIRLQKELGGRPEVCNIYAYYYYLFEEEDKKLAKLEADCSCGALVCGDCKARLARMVKVFLTDFQVKREKAKDSLGDYLIK